MRRTICALLVLASSLPASIALAATQPQLDSEWNAGRIPFRDVPSDSPFLSFIQKLKDLNLTQGTGNGFFEPSRCASKAEVVKFALDVAGVTTVASSTSAYADVPVGWQRTYIETARAKGVLPHIDNTFRPNECASRIFTLLIILRAGAITIPPTSTTTFGDVTYPEHVAAVEVAKTKGIINGRTPTLFAPYEPALRQEMAKILMNAATAMGKNTDTSADRRPNYDTAVRIQTIVDNFGTILTANTIPSSGSPIITRFAFVDLQYIYVDYTEGTAKKRVLLDMTKPDANFRIAALATFTVSDAGIATLVTGLDSKASAATTVYIKESTLWMKQVTSPPSSTPVSPAPSSTPPSLPSTVQLYTNTLSGYTLQVPKAWYFWNRGAQGVWANESLFATTTVEETNWNLAVRVKADTLANVLAADSGQTGEEVLSDGKLRSYADGSLKAFLPWQTSKTIIFETKATVTKDILTSIVTTLAAVAI